MYIPRFKSVLLERLLNYTDIPRFKRELHQRSMRNIDIPFSKSLLRERRLINRIRDCGNNFRTQLRDCEINRFTNT